MAKELPYFRFTSQEWQNGNISLESYELKGLFIDICAYYWVKNCSVSLAMLNKRFRNATELVKELIDLDILVIDSEDNITIKFLNEQFDMLSEKRKKRSEAGKLGGLKRSSNAKAMLKQKSSYKDNNKDNNKDKDKGFDIFWNQFHYYTKKPKTDKEAAKSYWKKLNDIEKQKAIDNIKNYYNSITDKKYLKKARTYLKDKNFNDEFKTEIKKSNPLFN